MQAALAAVPGALRAGSDSSQRGTWGEAALENTARRKMQGAYLLLSSFSPLFRAEKSCGCEVGGAPQRERSCSCLLAAGSCELQAGAQCHPRATPSPISACQVPLQSPHSGPQHNLNSSCLLRRKILQTPAVPSVALSLSVITMNKGKKTHTGVLQNHLFLCTISEGLCFHPVSMHSMLTIREAFQGHAHQQILGGSSEAGGPWQILATIYRQLLKLQNNFTREKVEILSCD